MNKGQFLAMSLPYGLYAKRMHFGILKYNSVAYSNEFEVHKDNPARECCLPVCRPLSDLTKPIEHKGETFVPIKELCNLYGAKFDKPYLNNMCAGFIYGFAAHDILNLKNIEKNEFWKIHKLIEWHFDVAGLIEKGEAIDVNTLPENPYK